MEEYNQNELNAELNIVYRYLLKKGISEEDAQDAVQETAIKYLKYYDSIRTSKVRGWLIRVALNYYYDQCRKQNRYTLNLDDTLVEADEDIIPEVILLQKERSEEFNDVLAKLKPLFQELLLLKYQSGLSYEEIANLLGISVSSVKTNLFRARKKFESVYKEDRNE